MRLADHSDRSTGPGGILPVRRLTAWLGGELAAERDRWLLWVPVALGVGVALYFLLPMEPPGWAGPAAVGEAATLIFLGRRRPRFLLMGLVLGLAAIGFSAAQLRTHLVSAPALAAPTGPITLEGKVIDLDARGNGVRVLLAEVEVGKGRLTELPARVRVRVPARYPVPEIGARIRLRAMLSPPPAPAMPGAFDFQRKAFFDRIGAVGFAIGRPQTLAVDEGSGSWQNRVAQLRQTLYARVQASATDEAARGVAAALLTGKRGGIPDDVLKAMRDSGLAHLLAISGLHIGLVAGLVFFAVRALLALIPRLALGHPIKKWAAVVALIGAFGYLVISGSTVPTQRAFLMTALVLAAVVFDRLQLSMRLVAWAAVAVLLMAPESLLSASFQMSFAAVTALIATYEVVQPRATGGRMLADWRSGVAWRILIPLAAIALTSVVAMAATSPFAIYHFNRLAAYGLLANLVAVPITGMWIMPWGLAALMLMPLGLEGLALQPMIWGIELVIVVAKGVAGLPGAVQLVPAMPGFGLAMVALGGLWLCLWRRRWRLYGLVAVASGFAMIALVHPPDVLISSDGKLAALRGTDGGLWLSSPRRKKFDRDVWARRSGVVTTGALPRTGSTSDGRVRCDPTGCIYRTGDRTVALALDGRVLAEDCRNADAVVSTVPIRWRLRRGACADVPVLVGRFDLWRRGAHALWVEAGGVRVESVAEGRGNRPWVVKPRSSRRR